MRTLMAIIVIIACGACSYFMWQQNMMMKEGMHTISLLEKLASEKDNQKTGANEEVMQKIAALEEKISSVGSGGEGSTPGDVLDAAILLSKSSNNSIQQSACNILGQLGGEKAENRLIKLAEETENPYNAFRALSHMGSKKALPLIINKLKTGNDREKNMASGNLNELLTPEYVLEVAKLLPLMVGNNYNTRNIRNNIVRAVCESGDMRVTEYVLPFLSMVDENSIYYVLEGLGKLRDPMAAKAICEFIPSNDRLKRQMEQYFKNYPGIKYDEEAKTFSLESEEVMKKLLETRKKNIAAFEKALEMRKKETKEVF